MQGVFSAQSSASAEAPAAEPPPPDGSVLPTTPRDFTRSERIKGLFIERVMPFVNLTSYNNLMRARQRIAEQQHEIERLSHLLAATPYAFAHDNPLLGLVGRAFLALRNPAARNAARVLLSEHFGGDTLASLFDVYREADQTDAAYWDVVTAVRALAAMLRPRNFLEVGHGRGWTLAQVLAEAPAARCYSFDVSGRRDADASAAVRDTLRRVTGSEPILSVVPGNSHNTLPLFFRQLLPVYPPEGFDLIAVNGDQSLSGAWQDLYDLFPRVRVGGALVFGNLESSGEPPVYDTRFTREPLPTTAATMRDVWRQFAVLYPNFAFIDCSALRFQAGAAIRIRETP
jgi:predicted O-methyltransferase YrrM